MALFKTRSRPLVALWLLAAAAASAQQQPPAGERPCEIAPYRGAASPQGAVAEASMVNRGQACVFANYGVPGERGNPAQNGRITTPPKNGSASFVAPNAVYTPNANFVGNDEFEYEAMATNASGTPLRLLVRVKLRVTAPPRP